MSKKIISSDNIPFIIPKDHILLQKGILCDLNEEECIPIHSIYLFYIISPLKVPVRLLPELIRIVSPLSLPKFGVNYINQLREHLAGTILFYKTDDEIEYFISNYEEPIEYDSFIKELNTNMTVDFNSNFERFESLLKDGHNINILLKYKNFNANLLKLSKSYKMIFKDELITKHIIDNVVDINEIYCNDKKYETSILHLLCQYSNVNMLIYAINKGARMITSQTVNGNDKMKYYVNDNRMIPHLLNQNE